MTYGIANLRAIYGQLYAHCLSYANGFCVDAVKPSSMGYRGGSLQK